MNYLTYKEFEKIINELGYDVVLNDYYQVFVQDEYGNTIVAVDKTKYKSLDLYWNRYESLTDEEKDLVADPCWQLASTPLEDREEPKKYHLRIVPRFRPWFVDGYDYLKQSISYGNCWVSDSEENFFHKTVFTESEIEKLREDNDLVLFEKVEVE